MQDEEIVAMFLERDERAVGECREAYGRYLLKTAYNILGDTLDSEEALSDALMGVWNAIPPNRPDDLKTFLLKILRRSAIDILRTKSREKRRASEYAVSLDELSEIIPGGDDPEDQVEARDLGRVINGWLLDLNDEQRNIFVLRYYFAEPIAEISKKLSVSDEKVKSILFRLRKKLRARLEKECYI